MAESEQRTEAGEKTAKSMKLNSEAEYLAQQGAAAKVAMGKAFDDLTQHLGNALSLNTAAKDHPWMTVVAGAVVGFATAAVVTPSKTDSALKRLAAIEKALHPDRYAQGSANGSTETNGHAPKQTFSQSLVKELFSVLRPLAASGLSAMMAAKSAANETAEHVTGDPHAADRPADHDPANPL